MDESDNSCKKFDIFIIEDDEGLGRLMQKELSRHAYKVTLAGTGKQALTLINGTKKEILLVNYKLPDMSGKELIQKLIEKHAATPHFITLTGYGDEKVAAEMMKLGSDEYIVKEPKFLAALPEVVKHFCEHVENEQQVAENEINLKKNLELLKETGEMAKVGAYCLEDACLCIDLMEKLSTWIMLTELATIVCVKPFHIFNGMHTCLIRLRVLSPSMHACGSPYSCVHCYTFLKALGGDAVVQ
jgi:response regulator RpfG family c-di-GMP phosphodiesterase